MTAMPAEKWSPSEEELREIKRQDELDLLIDAVAYYEELTSEYPMTMVYRSLLEEARRKLKEAEWNYLKATA